MMAMLAYKPKDAIITTTITMRMMMMKTRFNGYSAEFLDRPEPNGNIPDRYALGSCIHHIHCCHHLIHHHLFIFYPIHIFIYADKHQYSDDLTVDIIS